MYNLESQTIWFEHRAQRKLQPRSRVLTNIVQFNK